MEVPSKSSVKTLLTGEKRGLLTSDDKSRLSHYTYRHGHGTEIARAMNGQHISYSVREG